MKNLLLALFLLSSDALAATLTTDNFTILIEPECEEGNVTCDQVKFIYSTVGFETKQTAFDSTVHTKCADGITPCAFQGYEFITDDAKYFIHNSGVLEVLDKNGNQLLVEQGRWQY